MLVTIAKVGVLELPHAVLDIKRDKPIVTMSWNADGHEINDLVQQLYNYWELAESCDSFSNEEIVGNIILSAILFGGLNEKAELNALLEHLRNPVKVRHYKDLNILFLESHSANRLVVVGFVGVDRRAKSLILRSPN